MERERFCRNTGHTLADFERMRWGEYLEICLSSHLINKQQNKK
jgi:hypothetical protein